jgi:molybdopterin/thiamine biosynthesis adenylyltransferase
MDGWLFIVTADVYKSTIPNGRKVKHRKYYYAKPLRISASDINIRIPKLECLKDKRIAVIGLGALGAPSAIEFAKAGVSELRIVDYDKVDAATTVRWPIGLTAAGYPKTLVVENFIKTNYPYTNISSFNLRIGSNRAAADTPTDSILPFELDSLNQLFDGISLLYDASAEEGVTHFLSVEARKRNIPFVNIWATEGALGGQVLRVIPGQTEGCWMCSMYHRLDEKITAPPFDVNGKIQTRGCGDITFTGAGFDLQNITLAGVRMAVSILSKECENSYPLLTGILVCYQC